MGYEIFTNLKMAMCRQSWDKLDIEARHVHYELWEIPKGEIFTQTVFLLFYTVPPPKRKWRSERIRKRRPACKTVADDELGMSSDDNV